MGYVSRQAEKDRTAPSTANVDWHLPAGSVYVSDEHHELDQATCDKIADGFAAVLNELLA